MAVQNPIQLNPQALSSPTDALFSDVIQIPAPVLPKGGLNYISPLASVAPQQNQFFSAVWGKSAGNQQQKRKQQKKNHTHCSAPYQRENVAPPPLMTLPNNPPVPTAAPYQAMARNQGNRLSRGPRGLPQDGKTTSVNLSDQQIGFLQDLLKALAQKIPCTRRHPTGLWISFTQH